MNNIATLEVENISKFYFSQGKKVQALYNISFTAYEGEIIGIIGPSGGGKTSLLEVLALESKHIYGSARFCGRDIFSSKKIRKHRCISFIPQESNNILNPIRTVSNLIIDSMLTKNANNKSLYSLIRAFGFSAADMDKNVYMLSIGQKHRLALLRNVLLEPRVLLMDEPFAGLDKTNKTHIIEALRNKCKANGQIILISTHDLEVMTYFTDRLIFLSKGHKKLELDPHQMDSIMEAFKEDNEIDPSIVKYIYKQSNNTTHILQNSLINEQIYL